MKCIRLAEISNTDRWRDVEESNEKKMVNGEKSNTDNAFVNVVCDMKWSCHVF